MRERQCGLARKVGAALLAMGARGKLIRFN